jgi:phage shock protein C
MESYKKLYRTTSNRVFAGVAGGLAEYFGVNPTLVRIAFILVFFLGGGGAFAYFLLWILTPRKPSLLVSFEDDDYRIEERDSFLGRLIKAGMCAILLLIIGAIFSEDIWMAAFVVGLGIGLYWFWKSREGSFGILGERSDGLRRSVSNKKIFGVFGGLAEKWNVDPTILRVIGVVLLFAGVGVLVPVYFLMAILVPKGEPSDPIVERVVIV